MDEGSPTPQVPQPMRAAQAPAGFTNLIPGKLIMLYWLKISMWYCEDMLELEYQLITGLMQQPGFPQQPGLLQAGLMQAGLIQAGMMQAGLMQTGVVQHPGLMQQAGLAQPGMTQCKMEVRIWSGKTHISKWPKSGWNWWNMINIVHIYAKQCEIMQKNQWKGSNGQIHCFCKGNQLRGAKNLEN